MSTDDNLFQDVAEHLAQEQFRHKVMLFQRCDNVLRQLLQNLDEITPLKPEEKQIYRAFIEAFRLLVVEMRPFWPEKTFRNMQSKITVYEEKLHGQR